MPPHEEFVHCTVCQVRTSKFTVIKEDRLCGGCLSSSTYLGDSVSAFKVEFIDQSILESSSINRAGFLSEGVVVKIENFITGNEPTSMQYDRMAMIENNADNFENIHHDRDTSGCPISECRVGFIPEGVVEQIENDEPVRLQHNRVPSRAVEALKKSPVHVKIEHDEDMIVDYSTQHEDQLVEYDIEPKIDEELTIEEPRLMDVQVTEPVDRKPLIEFVVPSSKAKSISYDACELQLTNTDKSSYHKRTAQELALNPETHRPPSPPKHLKDACRYCDHRTTSRMMLYKHYDECHTGDKINRCRICFLFFKGKVLFEKHIQEEHQGHQWQCDICLQGYDTQRGFKKHKGKCLGRLLFECAVCQESYVKKEGLSKHLAKHDASEDHESLFSEVRSTQKVFSCALCEDDRGYEEKTYNTHVKEIHNGYHLLCLDCGAKFRHYKNFVYHRSGQCRFVARPQKKVTRHFPSINLLSQCPQCLKCYKNCLNLKKHILRIHKAKPTECNVCGLKLASLSLMKTHKMTVHTEPKIECTHYQKEFSFKHQYQSHLISPQNKGSHPCEECGRKLKSKASLIAHIKQAHKSSKIPGFNKKPLTSKEHTCKNCKKCFSSPMKLRIHMKIHDPNRKQNGCEISDVEFSTMVELNKHMKNKDAHQEMTGTVCVSELQPSNVRDVANNASFLQNIVPQINNNEVDRKISSFSPEQIQCMCEALQQQGDIEKLATFLGSIPQNELISSNESLLRARCSVAYHRGAFHELYTLLKSHSYSSEHHSELQNLWFEAHYREAEKAKGRLLIAVDKYRLRLKYPLPKTIWDGEKTVYYYKEKIRNALKDCYTRTRYPTQDEKKILSKKTGLTLHQLTNWFKNRRQRDRTPITSS